VTNSFSKSLPCRRWFEPAGSQHLRRSALRAAAASQIQPGDEETKSGESGVITAIGVIFAFSIGVLAIAASALGAEYGRFDIERKMFGWWWACFYLLIAVAIAFYSGRLG
jgi:hypothetical protein